MTIATRWADNDAYGHVNNTVYYQWFDTAVNAWLVEAGLLDIEQGDPIGLVVETGCAYFAPLSFPGDVEVGIAVERLGNRRASPIASAYSAPGQPKPAAQGHFTHVYVGRDEPPPGAAARAMAGEAGNAGLGADPRLRRGIFARQPGDQLGGRRDLVDQRRCPGPNPRCRARPWRRSPTGNSSRPGRAAGRLSGSRPAATIDSRR